MEQETQPIEEPKNWYVLISPLQAIVGRYLAMATLTPETSLAINDRQNQMVTGEDQNFLIVSNLRSNN